MFTIGEFARLAQTTPRALRHWEDFGLLVPARIDAVSGYRQYAASQLPSVARILALRTAGFRLDEIAALLARGGSSADIEAALQTHRERVAQQADALREQNDTLKGWLRLIVREHEIGAMDIVVKPLPALRVAAMRHPISGFGFANVEPVFRPLLRELWTVLSAQGVEARGRTVAFSRGLPADRDLELFVAIPVADQSVIAQDGVELVTLLEVPHAATVVRLHSDRDTTLYYAALYEFLDSIGARPSDEPSRDVLLGLQADRPEDRVIEHQLPFDRPEAECAG